MNFEQTAVCREINGSDETDSMRISTILFSINVNLMSNIYIQLSKSYRRL